MALLTGLIGGSPACSDDGSPRPSAGAADAAPAAPYENSTAGLEALLTDLVTAVQSHDRARARALAESLALDAPERWFRDVFGDTLGPALDADYAPHAPRLAELVDLIEQLVDRGQTRVSAERFERAEDPAAVGYQARAIQAMRRPVPLYSARLRDAGGQRVFHLWSFVYQAGRFRWVGKMKPAAGADADEPLDELRRRDRERLGP